MLFMSFKSGKVESVPLRSDILLPTESKKVSNYSQSVNAKYIRTKDSNLLSMAGYLSVLTVLSGFSYWRCSKEWDLSFLCPASPYNILLEV